MNITHNKVYTMYNLLYKMKQLGDIILKNERQTVNRSQCSRLVKQSVAGNMCSKH